MILTEEHIRQTASIICQRNVTSGRKIYGKQRNLIGSVEKVLLSVLPEINQVLTQENK